MPDEVIELCKFYANQYGMTFYTVYDPCDFVLKGHIIFHNIKRNFLIRCEGVPYKSIANHFHTIIFDVLADYEIGSQSI